MTDDAAALDHKPDLFHQTLFILSLVALFVALWAWFVVFSLPFKEMYDQMGMSELPLPTELMFAICSHWKLIIPLAAIILFAVGLIVIRRGNRRSLNRITAVLWVIVALMPGFVYFTTHLPLIRLQEKLGGGS